MKHISQVIAILICVILLCVILLTLPAGAQDATAIAGTTFAGTPGLDETSPAPTPVLTPTPEATTSPVDDARLIQILVGMLPEVTGPVVDGMGDAFERSTVGGAVMWIVFGVVVTGAMILLYRSTPPARRDDIGRDLATGASTVLKQIDQIDPLKWTDIENRILKLFSTVIDQAVASGLQAAIDAEKEKLRANAAAKAANLDLNDPKYKG